MDHASSRPLIAVALFIILAAFAASNVLLTRELREGNERLTQGIDALRTAQKDDDRHFQDIKDELQHEAEVAGDVRNKLDRQQQQVQALQSTVDTLSHATSPTADVTGDEQSAAERYYKKYLYPKSTKQVSLQVPSADATVMQGLKIDKWLEFSSKDGAATLVGTGQPFLDIKPEQLNNENYDVFNQGRTLTMIVVNFRGKDDSVFEGCKKSMQKKFLENQRLAVFGHGIAQQVLHDGLIDEVVIDFDKLTNCGLETNP
jgi:hypothetical protein